MNKEKVSLNAGEVIPPLSLPNFSPVFKLTVALFLNPDKIILFQLNEYFL